MIMHSDQEFTPWRKHGRTVFKVALFSFYPKALDLCIALMGRLALAYGSPSNLQTDYHPSAPGITYLSYNFQISQI